VLGKIVTYVGPVCFLVVLLSGCTTTPYGNEAISLEELEGVWGGYADSQLATTRVTCTIRIPITFEVKDGRAISLCNDPRCLFDVALKENGGIKFVYKKAIPFEEGGTGVISHRDIHFEGQLSTSGIGKGSFAVSGCVGKWQVTKQTSDVPETLDVSGSWKWRSEVDQPDFIGGSGSSIVSQTGNAFSGTIRSDPPPPNIRACPMNGEIKGTVSGSVIEFTAEGTGFTMEGTAKGTSNYLSGDYRLIFDGTFCEGKLSGPVSMTRVK